jgi:hypothetical protein
MGAVSGSRIAFVCGHEHTQSNEPLRQRCDRLERRIKSHISISRHLKCLHVSRNSLKHICYFFTHKSVASMNERHDVTGRLQTLVAQLVATQPAGAGLCLIGGFRYRMLDRGPRRSVDIDFHWTENLTAKRTELIALFQHQRPRFLQRLGVGRRSSMKRSAFSEAFSATTRRPRHESDRLDAVSV